MRRKVFVTGDVEPRITRLVLSNSLEHSVEFDWSIDIEQSVMIVSFEPTDVAESTHLYPNETGFMQDGLLSGSHYLVMFLPRLEETYGDPKFLEVFTEIATPVLVEKTLLDTTLSFSYSINGRYEQGEVIITPGYINSVKVYPSPLTWIFEDLDQGQKYSVHVTFRAGPSEKSDQFEIILDPATPEVANQKINLDGSITVTLTVEGVGNQLEYFLTNDTDNSTIGNVSVPFQNAFIFDFGPHMYGVIFDSRVISHTVGEYGRTIIAMGEILDISYSEVVQTYAIDIAVTWEFRENLTDILFEIIPDQLPDNVDRMFSVRLQTCQLIDVIPGETLEIQAIPRLYDVSGKTMKNVFQADVVYRIETAQIMRIFGENEVTVLMAISFKGFIHHWSFAFEGSENLNVEWS